MPGVFKAPMYFISSARLDHFCRKEGHFQPNPFFFSCSLTMFDPVSGSWKNRTQGAKMNKSYPSRSDPRENGLLSAPPSQAKVSSILQLYWCKGSLTQGFDRWCQTASPSKKLQKHTSRRWGNCCTVLGFIVDARLLKPSPMNVSCTLSHPRQAFSTLLQLLYQWLWYRFLTRLRFWAHGRRLAPVKNFGGHTTLPGSLLHFLVKCTTVFVSWVPLCLNTAKTPSDTTGWRISSRSPADVVEPEVIGSALLKGTQTIQIVSEREFQLTMKSSYSAGSLCHLCLLDFLHDFRHKKRISFRSA